MVNLIYTIIPAVSLSIGFYYGFKIGKDSKVPELSDKLKHPLKFIKKKKNQKAQEIEEDKMNKILRNIDNYDGTSLSQEDI